MSKNILFVVEGGRSEPRFLHNLMRTFRSDVSYDVFTYRTNIHKMLEGMFVDGDIDHDLDFLTYLRSASNNREDSEILNNRFSDIYLVFDMDPQDPKYDPEKISKAAGYFGDSTDNGKLYLNYPMFESYRHIPSLEDLSYLDIKVAMGEMGTYKERVHREGLPELSQLSKITVDVWLRAIELNLRKAGVMLGYGMGVPGHDTYVSGFIQGSILGKQLETIQESDCMYVLNTSLFSVVDYNPSEILKKISDRRLSVS